jgi:hypothetical protein
MAIFMSEVSSDQLREAVERSIIARLGWHNRCLLKRLIKGKPVWEGIVHVFELDGSPNASRAYAWLLPIEGSAKQGSLRCYMPA